MNYDKNKRKSRKLLIRTVLIFLLPFFSINHALTQVNDSISGLNAGNTIYVITNRKTDTESKNVSFNNEVNQNKGLTFLKVQKNKSDEIVNQILSYDDFMAQITNKTSDWLLFVHGDSKTYNQSVKRGFNIQELHKINVIVFSWPSKEPDLTGLKNLNNSRANVSKSMPHFIAILELMDTFKKTNTAFSQEANLSMLLHSLGNVYLENLIIEPTKEPKFNLIFENVILNSAAVNQKMHKDWVDKINFQERIYITNNKSDFNLKGLHIFSKDGNQLGEKAKTPLADNANYVQFSKAVGFRTPTGTSHTYFIGDVTAESQNICDFYFNVFHGVQIDFSNQTQFIKNKKGIGYDILF